MEGITVGEGAKFSDIWSQMEKCGWTRKKHSDDDFQYCSGNWRTTPEEKNKFCSTALVVKYIKRRNPHWEYIDDDMMGIRVKTGMDFKEVWKEMSAGGWWRQKACCGPFLDFKYYSIKDEYCPEELREEGKHYFLTTDVLQAYVKKRNPHWEFTPFEAKRSEVVNWIGGCEFGKHQGTFDKEWPPLWEELKKLGWRKQRNNYYPPVPTDCCCFTQLSQIGFKRDHFEQAKDVYRYLGGHMHATMDPKSAEKVFAFIRRLMRCRQGILGEQTVDPATSQECGRIIALNCNQRTTRTVTVLPVEERAKYGFVMRTLKQLAGLSKPFRLAEAMASRGFEDNTYIPDASGAILKHFEAMEREEEEDQGNFDLGWRTDTLSAHNPDTKPTNLKLTKMCADFDEHCKTEKPGFSARQAWEEVPGHWSAYQKNGASWKVRFLQSGGGWRESWITGEQEVTEASLVDVFGKGSVRI